jgi:hypothetical protein
MNYFETFPEIGRSLFNLLEIRDPELGTHDFSTVVLKGLLSAFHVIV